ncbi:MBL fold metallo-hydrolase [[Phormidium ambiguum] IAM M-71]|uniref:MBL fold metallo-hydrolase n=2 Tax=[Phormidium ambiguum] IAM M-71 TaxID=454136 RepID=A0A1U7IEX9_9CYAN|nr:MBL fold metallo-hydrolase [Phormidium ambiguum IAM M-71]
MIDATISAQTSETETFNCTWSGEICTIDGVMYLECLDKTRFRVAQKVSEWMEGKRRWQIIPSTDSTGEVSQVTLVSSENLASDAETADICHLVGRVVQLGKRNASVQFKIKRSDQKTLKLTLVNFHNFNLKLSQLLKVQAQRVGKNLQILSAVSVEETQESSAENQVKDISILPTGETSKKLRSTESPPPNDAALTALFEETQQSGWQLAPAIKRRNGWEWEAVLPTTGKRARVLLKGEKIKVYEYASEIKEIVEREIQVDEQENITNRLIVRPLGAAKGIGASCFQVFIGPYEIVMDCGTRPKGYDPLPALDYLENPNLLLITHAHQDHIGAVPVFHSLFPGVRMICTPGTREIAHVMLQDCLKVQQMNEDSPELFDETDLERTLFRLETKAIGEDFEPLPGLKVRFINAGHIVGAACIYMQYGDRSLVYTGDYNTTSSRTTEGLKLADLPKADILITESTYGADNHPNRKAQESALLEAIAEVVTKGGNVLVPAFALGRAQEIILAIRTSAVFHKLKIPIFVDGLVRAVTDVFRDNLTLLPQSVKNFAQQKQEPFFDPNSPSPVIPITSTKQRPLAMTKPSVIIASSGMLTGGPSIYYATTLLERENSAIFISGYTDEESPGRLLQNLNTGDTVTLDGKELNVRAQVRKFNLSAHADKVGLTQVIHRVNPQHLILIHGSHEALHELSRAGDLKEKYYVHIPSVGDEIVYGQAPEHLSARRLAQFDLPTEFEVNIEAEVEGAWIRIPEEIIETDPRWQLLAGNGILKAKWEGFHLKLSPLTQKDIVVEEAIASGEDCCAVCNFFRAGKCQSEDSPLFSFSVDPTSKCLEFVRRGVVVETNIEPEDEEEIFAEEDEEMDDFYLLPEDEN